jgi:hypothetical protein
MLVRHLILKNLQHILKMSNSYDEIKKLLESSRAMRGDDTLLNEVRNTLKKSGLLTEQGSEGYESASNTLGSPRPNLAADTEEELEMSANPKEDKQQAYRVSGGVLVMHGKDKGDLEITTEEKRAYQETMDEFINEVSEMVDFYPLNVYPTSVEWSGKVIDQDLEFFYSIGENNGVYVNGTMSRVDDEFLNFITKLKGYFQKFKTKWAKVLAARKKTQTSEEDQ